MGGKDKVVFLIYVLGLSVASPNRGDTYTGEPYQVDISGGSIVACLNVHDKGNK